MDLPRFSGSDSSIWRRIRIIQFLNPDQKKILAPVQFEQKKCSTVDTSKR